MAEEAIVARDVLLAEHVGSRLHVCHVSTAGTVEILRQAKARGVDVTAEVTPHHLLLTDDRVTTLRPRLQGEPAAAHQGRRRSPARGAGRRHHRRRRHRPRPPRGRGQGLRVGGRGVRDARASSRPWPSSRRPWSGPACSTGPASRTGCPSARPASAGSAGTVARSQVGEPANLVLLDPAARVTVEPTRLASKSRNTPYAGMTLPSRVVATFLRGRPTVLDGSLA